jgi:hypothetical protein
MEGQMKYVIVNPKHRAWSTQDFPDIDTAKRAAGLDPGSIDHGMLARSVGYCVYEFGLFVPPAEQSYFSIGKTLIAGPALFYGVGEAGETIDLMRSQLPTPFFYLGANDVEAHIQAGDILRPTMAFNGELIWKWPDPAPHGMKR